MDDSFAFRPVADGDTRLGWQIKALENVGNELRRIIPVTEDAQFNALDFILHAAQFRRHARECCDRRKD